MLGGSPDRLKTVISTPMRSSSSTSGPILYSSPNPISSPSPTNPQYGINREIHNRSPVNPGSPSPAAATGSASPNSLASLTSKFFQYLRDSGGEYVSITSLCDQLGVQKRRLYDIINVLEGVGVIDKMDITSQIHVRLKKGSTSGVEDGDLNLMNADTMAPLMLRLQQLRSEEAQIKQAELLAESLLRETKESCAEDLYVRECDLSSFLSNREISIFLSSQEGSTITHESQRLQGENTEMRLKLEAAGEKNNSMSAWLWDEKHTGLKYLEGVPENTYMYSTMANEGISDLY